MLVQFSGFSSGLYMKEEIISICCSSQGYKKLTNCSLQQREFNFWLTAHEHSYVTWCKAERFQHQPVIKTAEQKCDFRPLTVLSEPPAGIQKTIPYVSCAFTENHNTHHSTIREKQKEFRDLIIKSSRRCRPRCVVGTLAQGGRIKETG